MPDDITTGLPAPRDDEPAQLRRDIADELADHLRCAVRREQLRDGHDPPNEQAALQAAIEHFGEPTEVARRLWWDAMKEKLMPQRVLSATMVAMLGVCLLMCGLVWRAVGENQAIQQALVDARRESFASLIAQLKTPPATTTPAATDELAGWQPLEIALVDPEGAPTSGYISFAGMPIDPKLTTVGAISQFVKVGDDGIGDLGSLPYGSYELSVGLDEPRATTNFQIFHGPARPKKVTVDCPSRTSGVIPKFVVSLSDEALKDDKYHLYYLAQFSPLERQPHHGPNTRAWNFDQSETVTLLVDSRGQVIAEVPCAKIHHGRPANGASDDTLHQGVPPQLSTAEPRAPRKLQPGGYHLCLGLYLPKEDLNRLNSKKPTEEPAETAPDEPASRYLPEVPTLYRVADEANQYAVRTVYLPADGSFVFRIDDLVVASMDRAESAAIEAESARAYEAAVLSSAPGMR